LLSPWAAAARPIVAAPATEAAPRKSQQRKCLEVCQQQVAACMKEAKEKPQKEACAEAAIACLRECGMGGPSADAPKP
jgi:hypothetical protein